MTNAEFLLARIAEGEAEARLLATAYENDEVRPPARLIQHYALVNPARVLAECEAKRRIVNDHLPADQTELDRRYARRLCITCGQVRPRVFPCRTLRSLAAVYADHPDYDPAWRP